MNRAADFIAESNRPVGCATPTPATVERTRKKQPRWWGILCGFVGNHLSNVSPPAAVCWLYLFRNRKGNGIASESQAQIASATGLSTRHVRRCIRELEAGNLLKVESRGNQNAGPSRYRLLSTGQPCPPDADSQPDTRVRLDQFATGHTCPPATGQPCPPPHEGTGATRSALGRRGRFLESEDE